MKRRITRKTNRPEGPKSFELSFKKSWKMVVIGSLSQLGLHSAGGLRLWLQDAGGLIRCFHFRSGNLGGPTASPCADGRDYEGGYHRRDTTQKNSSSRVRQPQSELMITTECWSVCLGSGFLSFSSSCSLSVLHYIGPPRSSRRLRRGRCQTPRLSVRAYWSSGAFHCEWYRLSRNILILRMHSVHIPD